MIQIMMGVVIVLAIVFAIIGAISKGVSKGLAGSANKKYEQQLNEKRFNVDKRIVINDLCLFIDAKNKRWSLKENNKSVVKIFDFEDLLEFEIHEDGKNIVSGKAGGAIIGGLMFGVVGAIIGAGSSGQVTPSCTSLTITMKVNGISTPKKTIHLISSPTERVTAIYKNSIEASRKLAKSFAAIQGIEYVEKQSVQEMIEHEEPVEKKDAFFIDNEEVIKDKTQQLDNLRNDDIISQNEYDTKKVELLNRL